MTNLQTKLEKENGVPPVLTQKKSVRKRMSSSTPELNPTETIILNAEEEPNQVDLTIHNMKKSMIKSRNPQLLELG